MLKKALLVCMVVLVGCNEEGAEEVNPLPDLKGDYEHLFFFFENLRFTEDSLFVESVADADYNQLNDSIMIINNGASPRTVNYRKFPDGQLYFSYSHSFNDQPLKIGRDSLIYEMYKSK